MSMEIKVPPLGESVTEATVARWTKAVGDHIGKDENLVELETDKVTLDVPSPVDGKVISLSVSEGETVGANAVLAIIEEGAAADKPAEKPAEKQAEKPAVAAAPVAASEAPLSPAVRRLVDENNLDPNAIAGTGKDGRLTKGDVLSAMETPSPAVTAPVAAPVTAPASAPAALAPRTDQPREERVPMSRLRQVIARRLKDAQNSAAMLTTFNEVDMSAVMAIRAEYKDSFEKRHGVKLGFMSFFVHAVIEALKDYPAVNAEIHGTDIIYKNYYNVGVAVGTPQGLVVPVLKDADQMSFAETEATINSFGEKARQGQLSMADMSNGTFTISNGGIYGSMLSTPILNPPQSGILGMHNIQKRPVVVSGKDGDSIVIKPMMYLALSYDHRIIDGREAVSFLVRVKQSIEDPKRLLIGL
ncbi:MAG: 2-oxoglutarate dehydrogenase complex dihydrolipoyllysine-residue succinyltransferase [Alphaproteobacteria bacterium]|nr:2-oxoglutarate dehydrogenase complex dihydrolipoyllysine-residue succinyltransferase [Alphaproteobacteria bacterium]MDG2465871.1 2-oxoglutarate dehydrogenase complex dihydrolipoyllysine-residue succinyltransferase [Alphaproteobacteria bacterium]